eukprot:13546646-Ditylum_brightwellii.AAC.1
MSGTGECECDKTNAKKEEALAQNKENLRKQASMQVDPTIAGPEDSLSADTTEVARWDSMVAFHAQPWRGYIVKFNPDGSPRSGSDLLRHLKLMGPNELGHRNTWVDDELQPKRQFFHHKKVTFGSCRIMPKGEVAYLPVSMFHQGTFAVEELFFHPKDPLARAAVSM